MTLTMAFETFMEEAEPRLRRALVARHGVQAGREATLDAFVYAWRNWDRVREMENAVGYLYRVGASRVFHEKPRPLLAPVPTGGEPWIEPGLEAALQSLSEPQRVTVVLRHSFEWTYDEIAELLEVSVSTVRNHLARGMDKLRSALEVASDG